MNVSYIVTLDLPNAIDPAMIGDVAADIEDELITSGFEVISVDPWARPTLGLEPDTDLSGGIPPLF
jgi:hypothetical protein